jgi:hypothetical protein
MWDVNFIADDKIYFNHLILNIQSIPLPLPFHLITPPVNMASRGLQHVGAFTDDSDSHLYSATREDAWLHAEQKSISKARINLYMRQVRLQMDFRTVIKLFV